MSDFPLAAIAIELLSKDERGQCIFSTKGEAGLSHALRALFASGADAEAPLVELLKLAHVLEKERGSLDAALQIVKAVLSFPEATRLLDTRSGLEHAARDFRSRFAGPEGSRSIP